jgi:hypothetical protein
MNNTFELKKGKLVFEEDKIVIADDAKTLRRLRLFSSSLFLFLALGNLIDFILQGEKHAIWSAVLFGITAAIMILSALLMSAQNEIYFKDIRSIKIKRIFFRDYLSIKLANNKTRQVAGIFNSERLEEYIVTISLPNKLI